MHRTAIAVSVLLAATTVAFTGNRVVTRHVRDDATIFAILENAHTAEIESANLAKDRARTKEVKDFANTLVTSHSEARQQGRDLAQKLGITPTPPKNDPDTAAYNEKMTKLRGANANDFDRAFLEDQIQMHTAVSKALQDSIIPQIQSEELKTYATGLVPTVQEHLRNAQELLKKLPVSPSGQK